MNEQGPKGRTQPAGGKGPGIFEASARSRSSRAIRAVGLLIIAGAVVVAVGSFWIMTGASTIEPTPRVWTAIWISNATLIVLVVALVLTEIVVLWQARRRRQSGARLRSRLVVLFAGVATIPALIVAIFAAITLNQGLDQWFSERTRDIVESSRQVARSYLLEHAEVLRDDVIWVAAELEAARDVFEADKDRFQQVLTALAATRSLPFTSLVASDGDTLMRAQINVQGPQPLVTPEILAGVEEGVPTLLSPGSTNLVGSLVKLRGYEDTYLFAAKPVDQDVLEYMKLTDQNISEYRVYASNRVVFQLTF
ncbi:MAG TPA: hypothetical protein ENJ90_05230, partial [Devosia sp.]|nr:hypothetical protein [Devosia sp.]